MTTPDQPNPFHPGSTPSDTSWDGAARPSTPPSTPPPSPVPTPPLPAAQDHQPHGRNTVALVALVLAVLGFVFALIHGAMIVGWVLLPIAFILSVVGLLQHGRPKGMAIAALIVSVVGTIVGIVAFTTSVGDAVDDALSQPVTATQPSGAGATEEGTADSASPSQSPSDTSEASAEGTRENPYPLGSTISSSDWKVTVNSFTADATSQVLAANQFNEDPAQGSVYALANVTITYIGDSSGYALETGVAFVTDQGNVVSSTDSLAVAPDAIGLDELYTDASVTGNVVFEIPSGASGLLRVQPGMLARDAFVAIS